ncbi:MAG TPA: L,D-transpeptidase family protein [Capillimicrobium sp.]|nr:L,D-transpeptidase family protein [Capillimicrobium sp.]
MRPARPALAVLAALLALPAAAVAQTPAPSTTPTTTTPTTTTPATQTPTTPSKPSKPTPAPEPEPEPAAGKLKLGAPQLVFAGDRVKVKGRLSPHIAGQRVVVRILRDGKVLKERTVKAGGDGRFSHTFGGVDAGAARIVAVHDASRAVKRTRSTPRPISIIEPSAPYGSRGPSVEWLQRKLARLHYAVPRSGVMDAGTARAVIAFRKLTGMARTATADRAVFDALAAGKGAFKVKYPGHGRHVEGDLTHQVLALINPGGKVYRIYHTSSGAPATPTILGTYRVYRKDYGTNSLGMVHSSYFIRGYAIHGYHSVPTYNASHGCFRVPIPNALFIYNWVRMGTIVDSYYR